MKKLTLTLTILLILFSTSCSSSGSPLAGAKAWFAAFNEPNVLDLDNLTCEIERQYIRSNTQGATSHFSIYKNDWEGVEFKLLDQNSIYAIVSVQGEIKRVLGGTLFVENVDENMLMVRENKTWKWCGFTDMDIVENEIVFLDQTTEQEISCGKDSNAPYFSVYDDYYAGAYRQLENFRMSGYSEGGWQDPLAINDPVTRLFTGFIPGWFCVPERIETCEMMLGISLRSLAPEFQDPQTGLFENVARRYKQEFFFAEIRRNWDTTWLPYLLRNPNISGEVKDFYRAENRLNVCAQYAEYVQQLK